MNLKSLFLLMCLLGASAGADLAPQSLQRFQWKNRVVLVSAPSDQDSSVIAQRRVYESNVAGFKERDLVFVEALGEQNAALRSRYKLDGKQFWVLLIGKDGGVKVKSGEPLSAQSLFATIDAMPMRQNEMKGR